MGLAGTLALGRNALLRWSIAMLGACLAVLGAPTSLAPYSGPAHAQTVAPVVPEASLPRVDAIHPAWQNFDPEFVETVCPFTGRRDYDPDTFRCGHVLVPEDRTLRTSRLIKLAVVHERATGEAASGAMIFLTGGPGGPALGPIRLSHHTSGRYAAIREHMDLVFFDQRGIGYSGGDFCRAVPQPYQFGLPYPEGVARNTEALAQCFAEARAKGITIEGYTNWQNALDVRDIRRALGYDQWNVFGISYGTELAQGVMQVDPGGTRAVVLDSVVPAAYTTNDRLGMYAAGFRSSLTAVETMCAAHTDCRLAFPGTTLSERFIAAFEAFEADPLILTDLPPRVSDNGKLIIDGTVAAGAIFQALYRHEIYASLPALLDVLETRNEIALKAYVQTLGYPLDHTYGNGMSVTINCRAGTRQSPDGPAPHGDPEPVLSAFMGTIDRETACATVFTDAPDPTVTEAGSDIPTLVAIGKADPITPPYYADVIMPRLANAQRVDVRYTGHGALLSYWRGCGDIVTRDFFLDPTAPVDTSCLAAVPAPDFLTDIRKTQAPYQFGLGLQSGKYPLPVLVAGGILALLLVAFPLGALARRIDGTHSGDYGRARLLVWLGGVTSLTGLALAIRTILNTASTHAATLPMGIPGSIATSGWIALAGALLGAAALVALYLSRGGRNRTIGTRIAIIAGALASAAILLFLFSIDAGPIML